MQRARFVVAVVVVCVSLLAAAGLRSTSFACSGRKVLRGQKGMISDGPDKYLANAHCEWLIDAGSPNKTIHLEFKNMATECSFDFLFIYDGNSYASPLIASLSGDSPPNPVLATSGFMLLYLFSDRNYMKEGFEATYLILDCPWNCSGHGQCVDYRCRCTQDYTGAACDRLACPDNCSKHGVCRPGGGGQHSKCVCDKGYVGSNCGLSIHDEVGAGEWFSLEETSTKFKPRTFHTGAFLESTDCLWIFGGYDLNSVLNDLVKFCMTTNEWESVVQTEPWPSARKGHAMAAVSDGLFIFGGILQNGSHSNDLWFFNATTNRFSQRAVNSTIIPLPVTGHTLTTVQSWIYLFGGKGEDRVLIDYMYRIDAEKSEQWERVYFKGGNFPRKRLVGHSTVYHKESKSLVVFGGYLQRSALISERTSHVHMFHVDDNYWSDLDNRDANKSSDPIRGAFHSVVVMGNYLVVYGGNTHIHHRLEVCYNEGFYFYHLGCHVWVNSTHFSGLSSVMPKKGRFGHIAGVAYGNIVLIAGGYSGQVRGDLIAFKVPAAVSPHQSSIDQDLDHCLSYSTKDDCLKDPECVFCTLKSDNESEVASRHSCVHRTRTHQCNSSTVIHDDQNRCPGICPALHTCSTCVSQGKGTLLSPSSPRRRVYNEQCSWCVKEASCQSRAVPQGTCKAADNTESGIQGWWNGLSANLTQLQQCVAEDFPAGLHWIRYRHPKNMSFPDEVSIIRRSKQVLQFHDVFGKELESVEFVYSAQLIGFIHPLNAPPRPQGRALQLFLGTQEAKAVLYLSTDDVERNKELVVNIAAQSMFNITPAKRFNNNSLIFPNVARGYRYYMEQETRQEVKDKKTNYPKSNIKLEWNGAMDSRNPLQHHPITAEFLEPYNNGSCGKYSNCLACMKDTLCGWCEAMRICIQRNNITVGCSAAGDEAYLITVPTECPQCDDHVYCHTCVADALCEWVTTDGQCTRRGRVNKAIRNITRCKPPCHQRVSCSDCIASKDECAWCENTETCLPFSDYVTRYLLGQCTGWVDSENSQNMCHNCSAFDNCKSCLRNFRCGWCYNAENPTIGYCVDGDFTGPLSDVNCSAVISGHHNVSTEESTDWSYDVCPDVEECSLGLHDCHANATCINTPESFQCECNQGFIKNGDICEKTCYYQCSPHGNCSGPPDFECKCEIGWTGEDCSENCGCHLHSTCATGVGTCDWCQHHTTGADCSLCSAGSFGDPLDAEGCKPCNCNGHGDTLVGECNNITGECYCMDNTDGWHCDTCQEGYYGNPRIRGKCYLQCDGRMILTEISRGALGTHRGRGVEGRSSAYCLWILTLGLSLTEPRVAEKMPVITLRVEGDLEVECSRDFIYVYDGVPAFVNGSTEENGEGEAPLLGAFCGHNPGSDLVVQAQSGIITVYFEATLQVSGTRGFNASYEVRSCPDVCHGNQYCKDGHCVCEPGFGGYDCDVELCPANCSYKLGQGECSQSYQMCRCTRHFGGFACDTVVDSTQPHLQVISDPLRLPDEQDMTPLGRVGHVMTTCGDGLVYVFGGYSTQKKLLNDMWQFDNSTAKWTLLIPASEQEPVGRYHHAMACIPALKMLYVFGGFIDSGSSNNYQPCRELWKFNIESQVWTNESVPNWLPKLAGHTLVQIDDTKLVVIGGFSTQSYFSDKVLEYDAGSGMIAWQEYDRLLLSGSIPLGMYGHTAVFHKASSTIYVYGGYVYKGDQWSISHDLFAYDIVAREWNLLAPEVLSEWEGRVFHAAVNMDDKMVIMGGWTVGSQSLPHLLVYRYRCNTWHKLHLKFADLSIKQQAVSVVGVKAVSFGGTIYAMGGFTGTAVGTMSQLTVPGDICSLIDVDSVCDDTSGCSLCVLSIPETGKNKTLCYSSDKQRPAGCSRSNNSCNMNWHFSRSCYRYTTCSQCLAVYPQFKAAPIACQWCTNCPEGKCVPRGVDCKAESGCGVSQNVITKAEKCVEYLCSASDCDMCSSIGQCIWTRHFKRSTEIRRYFDASPKYNWNCVTATLLTTLTLPSPMKTFMVKLNNCTQRCYTFTACTTCLTSVGGEGGSRECMWSETLQECMPPAYLPLRCSFGECGYLIDQRVTIGVEACPRPCYVYTKCSQCIMKQGCGWCALGGQNGKGVCMAGRPAGPSAGMCSEVNITLGTDPMIESFSELVLDRFSGAPTWSFSECPPENECQNGHHTCNPKTQNCIDTPSSFKCECKNGYIQKQGDRCDPVCHEGCVHGQCIHPDKCQCHFGWVGDNCSVECQCNKHSNCRSVKESGICLQCHNNTQGPRCQECKPKFVGNPHNGGSCVPCSVFCNNHTNLCFRKDDDEYGHPKYLHRGPKETEAVCKGCQHNTDGEKCEMCVDGYFRLREQPLTDGCRPCMCNGHSYTCDKESGESCKCSNNTESKCDSKDSKKQCWEVQCSTCKEYFLGTPVGGHQCYRQMTVDRDYCFDPETQKNCNQFAQPLRYGRTVFFAVQPKYLNVNIRITIDVTKGGADVYFSNKEDTFQVLVDPRTGIHQLAMDPIYRQPQHTNIDPHRTRRHVDSHINMEHLFQSNYHQDHYTEDVKTSSRQERSSDPVPKLYVIDEMVANDLNTFITISRPDTILFVRQVHFRLVLTLPRDVHHLRTSRFYIVLKSIGSYQNDSTYGNLYFRQDQPHIDLFVFFSVFFSCFFLFLAMCVMLWKMKQAFDTRRIRQVRAREMECMASRPFAKALVLIDFPLVAPVLVSKRTKCATKLMRNLNQLESPHFVPPPSDDHLNIVPIAVEPTDDGVAAVGTVVIQLPGGIYAPSKLCLGSTLTMRLNPPVSSKSAVRRRASASSC
ncbi:multiple epidermal growth factor-like domains protein 8 [Gigantopelta aegis]|uniref:multiple epidermal growth factor-like domains protein 8 n=1 Tax=Gigantopelta aegis TaxID=1735272 RepID=UPI001B88C199|nr:multiple epidermal growth factor-like domains protein 8 [Gigantopelta aegis]